MRCALCSYEHSFWLGDHVVQAHNVDMHEYEALHGSVTDGRLDVMRDLSTAPRIPIKTANPKISFAGVSIGVNVDVPAPACLPLPQAYRIPEHGLLAADVQEAAIAMVHKRSTYIWGLPGTGKDALFHAWSALTRTPAKIFQIEPGEDIRAWFFSHELDSSGSYWKDGEMLKALRDGYVTETGRVLPYLILITDFDRATGDQAESMRLVMDSISGRVKGASGQTFAVLPGTQIVVTANSSGGGDSRGRCLTSKPIDGSIMDRFERGFQFHSMDWRDEEIVVREKFPILWSNAPELFTQVGAAVASLREAIDKEELYTEFSHRAVCAWLGHAQDVIDCGLTGPNILKRAFRVVADKMPDPETRECAYRIIDPFLKDATAPSRGAPTRR